MTEHPPGYKEGTYIMTYKCHNCGRSVKVRITQGNRAPEKVEKPCPNCGCLALLRQ